MKHKPNFSYDDLLVVLVLYQEVLEKCNSFITLAKTERDGQNLDLVVYDNSPIPQERPEKFQVEGVNVRYISDTENPGIGKAYNRAVEIARQQNKKWLLFLDQDTGISSETISLFMKKINEELDIAVFATTLFGSDGRLISPSRYRFKRGFSLAEIQEGRHELKNIRPINSLLMLSLHVFDTVGGYNEKIKLDFSDHEFLGRVQQTFKEMYVVPAINTHSLSTSDDTNEKRIRTRFKIFCKGAHVAAGSNFADGVQYFIVCFLRAVKLNLRFRTFFFTSTLFKEWSSAI
ncbi:MAG: glycosyltransferase [Flavobacteriaceae bacterium]